MRARKRELRVILRPERVGHAEVISWLESLARDGRGVSGLQEEVVAVLATHVKTLRTATAVKAVPAAPSRKAVQQLVTRPGGKGRADAGTGQGAGVGQCGETALEMAAARLEF